MILITKIILASFLRPTGIRIFLTFLCVTPVFNWRISCLDSLIFFSGVTLNRHANNCRINDLSLASHKTGFGKESIELVKQLPYELMLLQFRTEEPDRLRIGNTAVKCHIQKTHETQPIHDLIFHLVIAQIVQRLQNQYLEHHHDIERSAPGIALAFMVVYDLKISAEFLPRHKFFQARQHIAVLRQIIQTIVYVK